MDSLSSDASFMFNPQLRQPSSYLIRDNNSQISNGSGNSSNNNNNNSYPVDIAPSGSNSCLRKNIEEENELHSTSSPPVDSYTSDFVTPGGYIEEIPVDPQTIHIDMDNIDPVARDIILRGFEERKKREGNKKEDSNK